nr:MAG TPA: hypothetical protein [Caudoviricetes sp.]
MSYRICFRSYFSSIPFNKSCTCRNDRATHFY